MFKFTLKCWGGVDKNLLAPPGGVDKNLLAPQGGVDGNLLAHPGGVNKKLLAPPGGVNNNLLAPPGGVDKNLLAPPKFNHCMAALLCCCLETIIVANGPAHGKAAECGGFKLIHQWYGVVG